MAVDNLVPNAIDTYQHGSVRADTVLRPFFSLVSNTTITVPRAAVLTDYYSSDSLHQVVDRSAGTRVLVIKATVGV